MTAAGPVASDPAAIRDFFERLYPDPEQLPADARVGIWRLSDRHTVPFDLRRPGGLDALVDYAAARAAADTLYANTCPQPASLWQQRPTARGEAATALAMAGLVVDLDYGTQGHAAAGNPPDEAAVLAELPRAVPLRPTLLVRSGHGLYAWWLFKELLLLDTPEARRAAATLALRLQHTVRAHWQAGGRGWHLDSTADLARCLRFPGAVNRKPGLPPVAVRLLDGGGPRYDPDDLDGVLLDDAFLGATLGAAPCGERGEASERSERDAAFTPASLPLAEAHCAFLRHARDEAADAPLRPVAGGADHLGPLRGRRAVGPRAQRRRPGALRPAGHPGEARRGAQAGSVSLRQDPPGAGLRRLRGVPAAGQDQESPAGGPPPRAEPPAPGGR